MACPGSHTASLECPRDTRTSRGKVSSLGRSLGATCEHRLWSESWGTPWPATQVSFSSSHSVMWGPKSLPEGSCKHFIPSPSTLLIPLFGLGGRLAPDGRIQRALPSRCPVVTCNGAGHLTPARALQGSPGSKGPSRPALLSRSWVSSMRSQRATLCIGQFNSTYTCGQHPGVTATEIAQWSFPWVKR